MHSCVFRYPYFNFLKRGFFYLLEKWAAGFTDKIITITEALRKTFVGSRIAPAEKFITIYSGIELEKFRVQVNKQQKKSSLGINADDLVVGIVGRLAEGKGHEFVIQAVPLVIKEIPRVKFIFVGGGPLKNQLEDLALQVGVKDKVIFTGERNDVPELLAVFDVFCLASLYEGMSRAILEAQVAGKPVVATRIGGIPDVVLEGKTAFLVEPKDSAGLAAALIRILKDENLRKEMSRSAGEFVGYQFSAQKMVEDVVKVYNELLRLEA
jgi:glycosyltransferase involved in cell wall biosynthesis